MRNPLVIHLVITGLIGGFCMWLAIRLVDTENPKNKFIYAFFFNFIFGLLSTSSIGGFLITLFVIAVLAFTLYELEPAQVIGVAILIVIFYALLGGLFWLLKGILPDSIRPYLTR